MSQLTRLECRTKPMADGNSMVLGEFDAFFDGNELLIGDVTTDVIDLATRLRAKYRLRTPDVLHVASAVSLNANTFLTGDRQLSRVTEIPVEVI